MASAFPPLRNDVYTIKPTKWKSEIRASPLGIQAARGSLSGQMAATLIGLHSPASIGRMSYQRRNAHEPSPDDRRVALRPARNFADACGRPLHRRDLGVQRSGHGRDHHVDAQL